MIDASLLVVMGVLYAVGIYLLLERSLTKVLLGIMLITNATNIFIIHAAGPAGLPALYRSGTPAGDYLDPMPQALVLTAIVISFAVTALMLGMIYRSWILSRQDLIQDDVEDRRVANQPDYDPEDDDAAPVESSEFEGSEQEREEQYRARKEREAMAAEEAHGSPRLESAHLHRSHRDRKEWSS